MSEHGLSLVEDADGWNFAECSCGWIGPPCPGIDIAAEFWADHLDDTPGKRAASITFHDPEAVD